MYEWWDVGELAAALHDEEEGAYTVVHIRTSLLNICYKQVPAGIRDLFKYEIKADAFYLGARLVVIDPRGEKWETDLETVEFEGVEIHTKIPDVFIGQLCLLV